MNNPERRHIKIKEVEMRDCFHIASTLVSKRGDAFWVSTIKKPWALGLYETMIFPDHDYSGTETCLEKLDRRNPLLHQFVKTNMTREEALTNHRQAIEESFRTLLVCGS